MIDGIHFIKHPEFLIDQRGSPLQRVPRADGVLELSFSSGATVQIPLDRAAASRYIGVDREGNRLECEIETELGFLSGEPFVVPRAPGDRRVPDRIRFSGCPWHEGGYYSIISLYNDSFLPQESDKDNPEAHRKLPHPRNHKADP